MPRGDTEPVLGPLQGKRVAVTRPLAQAGPFVEGLGRLGAEAIVCPTIRIADPSEPGALAKAAANLMAYDWIVFTSANGVRTFWEALREVMDEPRLPPGTRVAAIGPATAESLARLGVEAVVVPGEYGAEAVADALVASGEIAGRRVLLPRAAGARKVLPERLRAAGAWVDEVVAYEARADLEGIAKLRGAVDRGEIEMVTFTAASTVTHFVEHAGAELGRANVAVIGPITAEAARRAGVRVDVEAREYTVDGLLQAICDFYRVSGER